MATKPKKPTREETSAADAAQVGHRLATEEEMGVTRGGPLKEFRRKAAEAAKRKLKKEKAKAKAKKEKEKAERDRARRNR